MKGCSLERVRSRDRPDPAFKPALGGRIGVDGDCAEEGLGVLEFVAAPGSEDYHMPQMTQLDAFSGYGEVIEARIIMDRESGRSKGFGFVTYESTEAAAAAISAMDGKL
ncbi:glycine-rich RNA-binding protein GRP2A-like [Hordeum vulgare]|nr:glycine-rich RNA-binding protein GRP2A-like [Hordeum vulgare]